MAKPRNSNNNDPSSEESGPNTTGSTDSPSDEPVNLTPRDGGVLHNPPQATRGSGSDSANDE